jgi:hypothetical protein
VRDISRFGSNDPVLPAALRTISPSFPLLAALLITAVVHWPLLDYSFVNDDYIHLYRVSLDSFPQFLLRTHGGHLLGVWRGIFWVYDAAFGLRTELWFGAVIATHLVNVALLYGSLRCLTGRATLAGGISALWGVSPLAHGTLSWLSVYPNVLLTTWVLWTLYEVVRVARRELDPSPVTALRWLLLMLAAANSFGIGLGIALAFPFVCSLLVSGSEMRGKLLLPIFALLVVVPIEFGVVGGSSAGSDMAGLSDWLFSSSRIWLVHIIPSFARLVGYGVSSASVGPLLALDPHADHMLVVGPLAGMSLEISQFIIGALALAVLGALAVLFIRADSRTRREVAAFALLVLASYGPVAVGRWWQPLAWVQPRYHYLGSALVWLAICPLLGALPQVSLRLRRRLTAVALVWIGLATFWSFQAVSDFAWGDSQVERRRFTVASDRIEKEILAVAPGDTAYVPNRNFRVIPQNSKEQFPGWAGLFVILHPENEFRGRYVRFVETDAELLTQVRLSGGPRMRELLVSESTIP